MDMKTMAMPTGATASATGHMPMATGMSMSMGSMEMVFFTSTSTPLWTSTFTPKSTGQYAGACIFLIVFALLFRVLLACRIHFYDIMASLRLQRQPGLLASDTDDIKRPKVRPWKADEAVMVGTLDVAVAGVSYLLMLAVMTMNIGYFLSILAGVFLGGVICGRFIGGVGTH